MEPTQGTPPRPPMPWVYDDGGRADAGYLGRTSDCAVRALAIAGRLPYQEVYDALYERQRAHHARSRRWRGKGASPRNGVVRPVFAGYARSLGWQSTPTMGIGTGCTVHLTPGEVPTVGRHVLSLSKHWAALIDGVVHDTHDPSRGGLRCVYAIWTPPT